MIIPRTEIFNQIWTKTTLNYKNPAANGRAEQQNNGP